MIISFAWTIDPLLAGLKTCTRRAWSDPYFQLWVKAWRDGRHIHQAWDKSPRFGGHQQAWIRLTCEPYRELLADMPDSDLVAEGGLWGSRAEFMALFDEPDKPVAVVRFVLSNEKGSSLCQGTLPLP